MPNPVGFISIVRPEKSYFHCCCHIVASVASLLALCPPPLSTPVSSLVNALCCTFLFQRYSSCYLLMLLYGEDEDEEASKPRRIQLGGQTQVRRRCQASG
ncbi:hypothetical protein GDO78_022809 [Eleutherodactylus coqui]|uniref:Uncharacterized protein n=1 Tax=Eleutherodactylus coqui TaxID=57060 RepID=A0A8J6EFW2_ELECQ|nr:hypothetical protein GDO78_022809 [Eleutherodactylus coqui]